MDKQNTLVKVHSNLENLLKSKASALPKNFNQTRFLQNCMVVLQDTKDIEKVEPQSIARTMLKGAFLGLDFFNRECYAVPYNKNIGTKDKPQWVTELQFQSDYRGEIKLCKKYSLNKIHDIYAKLVREGDLFEEVIREGIQVINFQPKPFNDGEIIGAFAVCLYENGSMIYETMSVAEIEHVRNSYSKKDKKTGNFSPAWRDSFGEMAKKTVLRRLCKLIEWDFTTEQRKAYDAGSDAEFVQAEVIEPEPVKMPKSTKQQVPSTSLRKQIETLFAEKKGDVSPELATQIDNWITNDARALTPDDIDEEGGRQILAELEKL